MKLRPFLLACLLLLPALAFGHGARHHANAPTPSDENPMGLQERLGQKLPLDVILRDEGGRPVRLGSLVTGPTLVVPGYYGCTNVCNSLFWGITGILPQLKLKPGEEYRVVSISIDETEGPQIAARYKAVYLGQLGSSFPPTGWRFLTGDSANIRTVMDAAGYAYQRKGRELAHPVASFVISSDGTIVRYLYGTSILPKDLALALAEARQGRVGATIRTAVRYCFSFDQATKSYQFNLLRVSATVVIICTGLFLGYLILGPQSRVRDR